MLFSIEWGGRVSVYVAQGVPGTSEGSLKLSGDLFLYRSRLFQYIGGRENQLYITPTLYCILLVWCSNLQGDDLMYN